MLSKVNALAVLAGSAAALALVVGLSSALAPARAVAEEENRGPAQVTINDLPGPKQTAFDHHEHFKVAECAACHHTGKNVSCAEPGCHGGQTVGKVLDLKLAFHKRCIPCHAKSGAPVKCAGPGTCHGS